MTAETRYRCIPDNIKTRLMEMYEELGASFSTTDNDYNGLGYDMLVSLRILEIQDSNPGTRIINYRFKSEAKREIEESLRKSSSESPRWTRKPYSPIDPEKAKGQLELFMPYIKEFIKYIGDRHFTSRDVSEFAAERNINNFYYPPTVVAALFNNGYTEKIERSEPTMYRFLKDVLEALGV